MLPKIDPSARHWNRTTACCGVLCAAVLLLGCGPDRPETVAVSGTITVDGAAPPAAGKIYFTPVEAAVGFAKKPGIGDFDTSGRFTVTTFERGDGLIPGKYRCVVHCWEIAPSLDIPEPRSYLPEKYLSAPTSGLELEIAPGSRKVHVDWDLRTQ